MKGTLHKTEQGWIIRYLQNEPKYIGERQSLQEIPIYPDYVALCSYIFYEGKEIEFEILQDDGVSYAHLFKTNTVNDGQKLRLMYKGGKEIRVHHSPMLEELLKETLNDEDVFKAKRMKENRDIVNELIKQGKELESKTQQTLYTEEQVNQKMIDFAQWCRTYDNLNPDQNIIIEQLFTEYKSLNQ